MEPVDLAELLPTTLTVSASEYKYVADLELQLDELPPVICNRGDVGQVFMNLIVNAGHAIGDVIADSDARGKLTITAGADEHEVTIQIADSGTGIPREVADRVYEPFFTTKEVGRGTGQGLAIARTIVVDGHSGGIHFTSNPSGGTIFMVTLPIAGPTGRELPRAA